MNSRDQRTQDALNECLGTIDRHFANNKEAQNLKANLLTLNAKLLAHTFDSPTLHRSSLRILQG